MRLPKVFTGVDGDSYGTKGVSKHLCSHEDSTLHRDTRRRRYRAMISRGLSSDFTAPVSARRIPNSYECSEYSEYKRGSTRDTRMPLGHSCDGGRENAMSQDDKEWEARHRGLPMGERSPTAKQANPRSCTTPKNIRYEAISHNGNAKQVKDAYVPSGGMSAPQETSGVTQIGRSTFDQSFSSENSADDLDSCESDAETRNKPPRHRPARRHVAHLPMSISPVHSNQRVHPGKPPTQARTVAPAEAPDYIDNEYYVPVKNEMFSPHHTRGERSSRHMEGRFADQSQQHLEQKLHMQMPLEDSELHRNPLKQNKRKAPNVHSKKFNLKEKLDIFKRQNEGSSKKNEHEHPEGGKSYYSSIQDTPMKESQFKDVFGRHDMGKRDSEATLNNEDFTNVTTTGNKLQFENGSEQVPHHHFHSSDDCDIFLRRARSRRELNRGNYSYDDNNFFNEREIEDPRFNSTFPSGVPSSLSRVPGISESVNSDVVNQKDPNSPFKHHTTSLTHPAVHVFIDSTHTQDTTDDVDVDVDANVSKVNEIHDQRADREPVHVNSKFRIEQDNSHHQTVSPLEFPSSPTRRSRFVQESSSSQINKGNSGSSSLPKELAFTNHSSESMDRLMALTGAQTCNRSLSVNRISSSDNYISSPQRTSHSAVRCSSEKRPSMSHADNYNKRNGTSLSPISAAAHRRNISGYRRDNGGISEEEPMTYSSTLTGAIQSGRSNMPIYGSDGAHINVNLFNNGSTANNNVNSSSIGSGSQWFGDAVGTTYGTSYRTTVDEGDLNQPLPPTPSKAFYQRAINTDQLHQQQQQQQQQLWSSTFPNFPPAGSSPTSSGSLNNNGYQPPQQYHPTVPVRSMNGPNSHDLMFRLDDVPSPTNSHTSSLGTASLVTTSPLRYLPHPESSRDNDHRVRQLQEELTQIDAALAVKYPAMRLEPRGRPKDSYTNANANAYMDWEQMPGAFTPAVYSTPSAIGTTINTQKLHKPLNSGGVSALGVAAAVGGVATAAVSALAGALLSPAKSSSVGPNGVIRSSRVLKSPGAKTPAVGTLPVGGGSATGAGATRNVTQTRSRSRARTHLRSAMLSFTSLFSGSPTKDTHDNTTGSSKEDDKELLTFATQGETDPLKLLTRPPVKTGYKGILYSPFDRFMSSSSSSAANSGISGGQVPPSAEPVVDAANAKMKREQMQAVRESEAKATTFFNTKEISFAILSGACSGYACKKFARTAGLLIGIGFIGVQLLARAQLVKVNWGRVQQMFVGKVDQNGDGKFDVKDVGILAGRLIKNLTYEMPNSVSFAGAFWYAFKYA